MQGAIDLAKRESNFNGNCQVVHLLLLSDGSSLRGVDSSGSSPPSGIVFVFQLNDSQFEQTVSCWLL